LVAGGRSNDPIIEGVWQTHPEIADGNAWTTSESTGPRTRATLVTGETLHIDGGPTAGH